MIIAGLQKTTLIDYPGLVAATIFTYGCSFRCGFCHNPNLVIGKKNKLVTFEISDILGFLNKRRHILEGVVITGGEPLINEDMPEFLREIKKLGYKVKVDTNGSRPKMLSGIIEDRLVDFVAMDVKNSLEKYEMTAGARVDLDDIQKSVQQIMASGLPYEFRTTVLPKIHEREDFEKIGLFLKGARKYTIQGFRPQTTLDPAFGTAKPFSADELASFKKILEMYVDECEVRDNL